MYVYDCLMNSNSSCDLTLVAFTRYAQGTEWPFMCWCVVKKLLTHWSDTDDWVLQTSFSL